MLIFLIKGKLTHTDLIFPILAAIKKKKPDLKIILIYPSKASINIIKDNKALHKSLTSICNIRNFYHTKELKIKYVPYILSGMISILHRNYLLLSLLIKKAYIFRITSIPKIDWLINFNRKIYKGKKISLFLNSFEFNKFLSTVRRTIQMTNSADSLYIDQLNTDSDAIISSYNKKQLKNIYANIDKHNYDVCCIGTELFNWQSWQKILIKNSKIEIDQLPEKFIFFPLAVLIRKDKFGIRDFRDSILKIVNYIREKDNNIIIIFRPHPTTSTEELKTFLKNNSIKNYIISFTNPIILIKYCTFVVRYGASLLDSRVMDSGKYLIRYFYKELAEDMKEELKYNANYFYEKNFIDVTDTTILRTIIHKTLKNYNYRKPNCNNKNIENIEIEKILKIIN